MKRIYSPPLVVLLGIVSLFSGTAPITAQSWSESCSSVEIPALKMAEEVPALATITIASAHAARNARGMAARLLVHSAATTVDRHAFHPVTQGEAAAVLSRLARYQSVLRQAAYIRLGM